MVEELLSAPAVELLVPGVAVVSELPGAPVLEDVCAPVEAPEAGGASSPHPAINTRPNAARLMRAAPKHPS